MRRGRARRDRARRGGARRLASKARRSAESHARLCTPRFWRFRSCLLSQRCETTTRPFSKSTRLMRSCESCETGNSRLSVRRRASLVTVDPFALRSRRRARVEPMPGAASLAAAAAAAKADISELEQASVVGRRIADRSFINQLNHRYGGPTSHAPRMAERVTEDRARRHAEIDQLRRNRSVLSLIHI